MRAQRCKGELLCCALDMSEGLLIHPGTLAALQGPILSAASATADLTSASLQSSLTGPQDAL
jgi:hypothetical protein